MSSHTPPNLTPTRIWDLPTRVFHVLLASAVIGLLISGEVGGDAMILHFWLGYLVFTLLIFRLIWGVMGGHWSKFIHFVPSPSALAAYIKELKNKKTSQSVGHNPLGALSVLSILSIALLQVVSGFLSDDEISVSGPWTILVPSDWVSLATEYHTEIGKVLLIILIVLHISTVIYYKRIKQEDLISPMLHGDKLLPVDTPATRDTWTSRLFALSLFIASAYVVYRLVNLT